MRKNIVRKRALFTGLLEMRLPHFFHSEEHRMLSLSMLFSIVLVSVRIIYTGEPTFIFLVWNLFLAWLPYALTALVPNNEKWQRGKRFVALFAAWLLFIPNSFYIITDLFHLGPFYPVPLWFDLVLILSFAWNGLLLGLLSVRQMEKIVQAKFMLRSELLVIYPIMWMNAWGVYIGRYLRFNSWDVVTNPFDLLADITDMLCHPIQYRTAWGMITCFSIFMTLMYLAIKRISKVIH